MNEVVTFKLYIHLSMRRYYPKPLHVSALLYRLVDAGDPGETVSQDAVREIQHRLRKQRVPKKVIDTFGFSPKFVKVRYNPADRTDYEYVSYQYIVYVTAPASYRRQFEKIGA